MSVRLSPALAKAKAGNTPKAIQGCSACSRSRAGEEPSAALSGIATPTMTPAMMIIAPRSSMIAKANKNIFSEGGAPDPSKANTPSAKAMSVAIGMAQPRNASVSSQLQAT